MQQAIIDIACGISVNITPQKDRAISQEDNILMKPKEGKEYADKKIRSKYN